MRKTRQMAELEREHGGRPIEELIADALTTHDTIQQAAEALGVKLQTLYSWMIRLRIERRRVVLVNGREVA